MHFSAVGNDGNRVQFSAVGKGGNRVHCSAVGGGVGTGCTAVL